MLMMATAFIAADDPGGWTAAKWGMTDAQILQAVPTATRLDPPDADAHVQIKSFPLAGSDFHVLFQSDKDGRLQAVLLSPIGTPSEGFDYLFQNLQNLLVEKYGRPWSSTEGHQTKIQWSLKTTTITLSQAKFPGIDIQILNLHYKRKDPDLEKM
jgi:hypothetical protein